MAAAAQLELEGVVCEDAWNRFEMPCALSFQRLTDPAKGSACTHRACCNYQTLRDYVGRMTKGPKVCPVATCNARLQRTRDVERDAVSQALLEQVPAGVKVVWLRGDEIRVSNPIMEARERSTTTGEAKRRSDDFVSSEALPRRSSRSTVVVLE